MNKSQLSRIGSQPLAFQRAIDEVCFLPLSPPKGGSKSEFVVLVNKNQFKFNKLCYKVFLRKTSSGKVVAEPLLYLIVYCIDVGGICNPVT